MKQAINLILSVTVLLSSLVGYSQSTAEQIYSLSPEKQLDYILDHIYEIRSANIDSGFYYINQAIELAQQFNKPKKEVIAYKEQGIIHFHLGNVDEELKSFQESLTIAERIDDKALQGGVLKEMGVYFNRQKQYRKAMALELKAEQLCREAGDSTCVASALRNYGRLFLKLNDIDSAEIFFVRAYEIKKAMNDSVGLPYALNDLGEIAAERGNFSLAVDYLKQSSDIRAALKDSMGLAININNIGEVYFQTKDYNNAIEYFEKSLAISRSINHIPLQKYTLERGGIASKAINDYKSAYQYLEESKTLNDSIYSVEKAKALSEMETKYETEKKEQIIKSQQADLRIQRLIGFSVLSVLLLIGSFVYYRIYQRRKYERQIQQLQIQQKIQKERERISRDLHDNVGANLTKIITDLDLLSLQLGMMNNKSSKRIDNTRNFTQSTIRLLRDTIWAMNKDEFSVSEFADKAEAFLGYYLEDNITWQVERNIETEQQLTPTQVLNLLRILQEATQNMLKYAKASYYQVTIKKEEQFSLSIKDDGVGMTKDDQKVEDSYGLYNMQQRAKDIGAILSIHSEKGKGVAIEVTL